MLMLVIAEMALGLLITAKAPPIPLPALLADELAA
jgi:hypothetical protein